MVAIKSTELFPNLQTHIRRQLTMEGVTPAFLIEQERKLLNYAVSIGLMRPIDADLMIATYSRAVKIEQLEMIEQEKLR